MLKLKHPKIAFYSPPFLEESVLSRGVEISPDSALSSKLHYHSHFTSFNKIPSEVTEKWMLCSTISASIKRQVHPPQ